MIKHFKPELRFAALIVWFIISFWLVDVAFDEMNKANTLLLLLGIVILFLVFAAWMWTAREVYLAIKNAVETYKKEGTKDDNEKSTRVQ